jgi:inorganic pyrophosphatase
VFCGKILGSFCLIDQGEVDWKVLVIDEKEAMDSKVITVL